MFAPGLMLALAAAPALPLTPPVEQGVTKNGATLLAVPSTSPFAVAAVVIARPDDMGADAAEATMPALAAAARAAAGRDGTVEVTWRPGSFALIITTPANGSDLALRAVDAALKAARSAPPKTPSPLPTPWRDQREYQVVPSGDVAGAFKALAAIGGDHVTITIVGPGPGPELLRRGQALIATPLTKGAVRNRRDFGARGDDKADHLDWPGRSPAEVAALEVTAELLGGHVHHEGQRVALGLHGPPGDRRAKVAAILETPPPAALLQDVAHARRLALAAPIDDPAMLALTLARDTMAGDDTFAVIDALPRVDGEAVKAAATTLLGLLP